MHYSTEQLHPDVIERELGEDRIRELVANLSDDTVWTNVATLAGDVWTMDMIEQFLNLGRQFTFQDTYPGTQQPSGIELKVFHRNYYGLELRRKVTYRELVEAVIQKEKYRRQQVNRGEIDDDYEVDLNA